MGWGAQFLPVERGGGSLKNVALCCHLCGGGGETRTSISEEGRDTTKMAVEESHENIIMIRGFPVSFPKVRNMYRGAEEKT